MARDPNQRFVTNTITRAQIAEDLNYQMDTADHLETDVQPDDEQLTDELCQRVANWVGEHIAGGFDADYTEQDFDEEHAQFLDGILAELGFTTNN